MKILHDSFFVVQYQATPAYILTIFRYPLGSVYYFDGWLVEITSSKTGQDVTGHKICAAIYEQRYNAIINALIEIDELPY